MNKLFLLIIFTLLPLHIANASIFELTKGRQFELCREIEQILDAPQNKDLAYLIKRLKHREFSIPKRFSNFSLPKWEDVPAEEMDKYIAAGKKLEMLKEFNKKYKPESIQMTMQKTSVDFDHNGIKDVMLRFRSSDSKNIWHCYASDITPNIMTESFNKFSSDCYLFSYKGRIFSANYYLPDLFMIEEPSNNKSISSFGMINTCKFESKIKR